MAGADLQVANQGTNEYSGYFLGVSWVSIELDQWIIWDDKVREALIHNHAFVAVNLVVNSFV
jgi:hypothetical protein